MSSSTPSSGSRTDVRARTDVDEAVPPYQYNPSSWRQRVPICLLALVAAAISTHLSLYQWGLIESTWDPVFGNSSNRVLKSSTAEKMFAFLGVHDAALGVLAYLGDAIFGFAGSTRRWRYRPWMVILFGIDVIPLGVVSVVLVLIQTFVLGEWCFLCLVTASISLVLVFLAWDEVNVSLRYLLTVWKQNHSPSLLWQAIWGRRDDRLNQAAKTLLSRRIA